MVQGQEMSTEKTSSFSDTLSDTDAGNKSANKENTKRSLPIVESFGETLDSASSSLHVSSFNSTADSAKEESFVTDSARPLMSDYGKWDSLDESAVRVHLASYGQGGGKHSFWNSLCFSAYSRKCHKKAVKFVTAEFESVKMMLADKCYDIFNKTLFKGMLPQKPEVKWMYRGDKIGDFRAPNVYIFGKFCVDEPFKVANAMLHLMCLAAIAGIEEPAYSDAWGQWTALAKSMFPELIEPTSKRMNIIFHEIAIFQYKNAFLQQI